MGLFTLHPQYRQVATLYKMSTERTNCLCVLNKKCPLSLFTAGKDITFVAKVDSSTLTRKPVMKWLKGKWLDLSSKAGKHLQFKESYDRNTKVQVYRLCHDLCVLCLSSFHSSVRLLLDFIMIFVAFLYHPNAEMWRQR